MIESINNFRSLNGIKTEQGHVKENSFFRGGALNGLNEDEVKYFRDELGITTVVDFRGTAERKREPDMEIEGVKNFVIPIIDESANMDADPVELMRTFSKENSLGFMEKIYVDFIENAHSRQQYHEFLKIVAASEGGVYFHCSAGKDRTGFGAFLILEILGANQEDIIQNYMDTNIYAKAHLDASREQVKQMFGVEEISDHDLLGVVGVREEYIQKSLELIYRDYGSVDKYLKEGIGVTDVTLEVIREKYQD